MDVFVASMSAASSPTNVRNGIEGSVIKFTVAELLIDADEKFASQNPEDVLVCCGVFAVGVSRHASTARAAAKG